MRRIISMREKIHIALTFDVELIQGAEEFTRAVPLMAGLLDRMEINKATWMIRADRDIKERFGSADWAFQEHGKLLDGLVSAGHEIGWHPHCSYGHRLNDAAVAVAIAEDLEESWSSIKGARLNSSRMGWGAMSNGIMDVLDRLGVGLDSSSIPRPRYPWDPWGGLWESGLTYPYHPSKDDYRRTGSDNRNIVEIPVSVTRVKADYDTMDVLRYINLAFHPKRLARPFRNWIFNNNLLVSLTHPHELMEAGSSKEGSSLIAHSIAAMEENIKELLEVCREAGKEPVFLTVKEAGKIYGGAGEGNECKGHFQKLPSLRKRAKSRYTHL